MKKIILVLTLLIGFAFQGEAQEIIAESQNTTNLFNPETFQTEVTKIQVVLGNVYVRWNADGTSGTWRVDVSIQSETADRITGTSLNLNISLLDLANQGTSVHDYIRDQAVQAVENVDPFGLTIWNKSY